MEASVASKLIKAGSLDTALVLNKAVPTGTAASVTRELVEREGVAWRDHHWVEYYSLGNVTRTGHLVDDSTSVGTRAIPTTTRFPGVPLRDCLVSEHVPRAALLR